MKCECGLVESSCTEISRRTRNCVEKENKRKIRAYSSLSSYVVVFTVADEGPTPARVDADTEQ